MWDILTPNVLITIAGGLFTIGYLIINQVMLRISIFLGSMAYLAYYATAADIPLWGAIYTTLIMTAANVIGFIALFARNASFAIPREHRDIYPLFDHLMPGDFRDLMKLAHRYHVKEDMVATKEDEPITAVYFVIKGEFFAEKKGIKFPVRISMFFGEAAYLMNRNAAATATFPAGTEILEWDLATLQRVTSKKPRIKLAFEAAIAKDLAKKIVYAVPTPQS